MDCEPVDGSVSPTYILTHHVVVAGLSNRELYVDGGLPNW